MHGLGFNQVLLWTCVTRHKSRKSELAILFVKGTPFHVPQLVGVRSTGAAPGGGRGASLRSAPLVRTRASILVTRV